MFTKYPSIENSYREEYIARIKGHGFENETFVVQEKAHGANLSFWTNDGIEFLTAKRTDFLQPDEKFYNHQAVLADLKPKLVNIWQTLSAQTENLHQLVIFGELIGGYYPHDSVPQDKTTIKVQKGVLYSPHNVFYAFDIKVNGVFLDVTHANTLFQQENMLHAMSLFEGDLQACLEFSNEFDSQIPKQLGLPLLDNNIIEGVIIKPKTPLYTNNSGRVMLKNKNSIWAEREKRRPNRKQSQLSDTGKELQKNIAAYVTENRLNNVISKLGEVTHQDFGMVIAAFSKDVIDDFSKDYASELADMEKKEIKTITKSFMKKAQRLVRQHLTQS